MKTTSPKKQHLRHIVIFRVHPEVEPATETEMIQRLRELGAQGQGIIDWSVERSLDTRKGRLIVQNGLFASQADFEKFRTSPLHQACGEYLKNLADWLVAGYLE